tara:strand:+ start:323 stop:1573 length:1251 start_codon:yes stop_codon:yes gene_type:complete
MTASVIKSGISKINVLTDVGSGLFPGTREDIFIQTRAVKGGDGSYSVDILQTNANGGNIKVIGERVDGKIIFNNNADNDLKRFNNDKLIYKTSKDQITSIKDPELIKDQKPNQSEGDGTNEDSTNSGLPNRPPTDNSRKKYGNLCYPVTLRRGNQDRLKITILDRDLSNSKRLSGKRAPAKSIGSVVLPVPGNLRDDNKVDFKNATLNPLEVAAAEVATAALLNPSSTGSEVKSLFDRVVSEKGDLKGLTAALFTGRAINRTANELLARSQGRVVNPNLELLFNGPTLRPFNFQFRLSPRDRGESIEIRKIIRMFKQSSAVKSAASTFFLRAPNTYKLQFFEGSSTFSSDHAFLPKIKECALLGFGVNYTPDGTFMSYENSSMVSYDITFAFQEIDPIINEDYSLLDSNSDNSIGF